MGYPFLQALSVSNTSVSLEEAERPLVLEVQELLVKGGFLRGSVDGIVGSITRQAMADFKRAALLEYPGIIGSTTAEMLLKLDGAVENNDQINLDVPYFSQRDNANRPGGTCNVTSVAMCLAFYGVKPRNPRQQLEDELFEVMARKGWDRHVHDHLARLFRLYGVDDTFTTTARWSEVKAHLAGGNPVIMSGQFTRSGHIIVLRGFDDKGFFVNDPWGEWFASGYRADCPGRNKHYSYGLMYRVSYGGANSTWAHFPQKV